ncbi:MAG: hypothetical protein ACHP84_01710 [Caulobacterales bacterium]
MTRPRKGEHHVAELAILIADAEPLGRDLTSASPTVRRGTERKRDIARDELIGMYRDAQDAGLLDRLDPRVRLICDEWRRLNGGLLPRRKGGRPKNEHHRLIIWLRVHDRSQAGMGIVAAMRAVAADHRPALTYEHIRNIWYDEDPEWVRLKQLTLAERRVPLRRSHRSGKSSTSD